MITVSMSLWDIGDAGPKSLLHNQTQMAHLCRRCRLKLDETKMTPEANEAVVECLRIAARRGRELRLARERAEKDEATALVNAHSAETRDRDRQPLAEDESSEEAGPPKGESLAE